MIARTISAARIVVWRSVFSWAAPPLAAVGFVLCFFSVCPRLLAALRAEIPLTVRRAARDGFPAATIAGNSARPVGADYPTLPGLLLSITSGTSGCRHREAPARQKRAGECLLAYFARLRP